MTDTKGQTTRRQFLQTATAASGSLIFLGMGCSEGSEGSPDSGADGEHKTDTDPGLSTQEETSLLFSKGNIGVLQLENRMVRAATGEALALNGEPTDNYLNLYNALASGGVGMIISGMTAPVESDAIPFQLYAFEDAHIDRLKVVKETVARANPECKLIAQIAHSGNSYIGETRTGPSDISWPGDSKPMRALTVEEIAGVVEDFAQAARRYQEAGWDGVEVHGAHGYLLSSFLSTYTNNRTDQYGGSVENRLRIVREILERTRELVGADYPVLIKLNSSDSGDYVGADFRGGIDQELFRQNATEIAKMGVDAIDVSGNNWVENDLDEPEEQSFFRDAAGSLDVDVPIILTGGNRSMDLLENILKSGDVDFIGLARPLIREPNLPSKWKNGESKQAKCISCNMCLYNISGGLKCHQEPSQNA